MTVVDTICWIVVRRRVSLAGHVIAVPTASDASQPGMAVSAQPLREVQLRAARALTADWRTARDLDVREVSATSTDLARATTYYAHVRSDGLYFFLDLPVGEYVLAGNDKRGEPIETKPVSIPPVVGSHALPVLGVDLIARMNQAQTVDSTVVMGQKAAPAKRRSASNEKRG